MGFSARTGAPVLFSGSPDLIIRTFLGALLWLIRNAGDDRPETVDDLRMMASGLLITRSKAGAQPIEVVVGEALRAFGTLMGLLERQYPELGQPRWLGNVRSVTPQQSLK
jgi:hypothetical protein